MIYSLSTLFSIDPNNHPFNNVDVVSVLLKRDIRNSIGIFVGTVKGIYVASYRGNSGRILI